jgi:phosphoribulokinase
MIRSCRDRTSSSVPGGKMGLAMQIIFTPMIMQLMDKKRRTR